MEVKALVGTEKCTETRLCRACSYYKVFIPAQNPDFLSQKQFLSHDTVFGRHLIFPLDIFLKFSAEVRSHSPALSHVLVALSSTMCCYVEMLARVHHRLPKRAGMLVLISLKAISIHSTTNVLVDFSNLITSVFPVTPIFLPIYVSCPSMFRRFHRLLRISNIHIYVSNCANSLCSRPIQRL